MLNALEIIVKKYFKLREKYSALKKQVVADADDFLKKLDGEK